MDRPRSSTAFNPRSRVLTRCLVLLAVTVPLVAPLDAVADSVVLPDPTSAADQAELAGAVSLLVRSYLQPGARPIVPRQELGLAIEAVTGRTPGKTLVVTPDIVPKLMDRLGSESLVLWELDNSKK